MFFFRKFNKLHSALKVYSVVFVAWGMYRLIFRLPEEIEEIFLKPLTFVGVAILIEKPKNWLKYFSEIWGKGDWLTAFGWGLLFALGYIVVYGFSSLLSFGSLQPGELDGNPIMSFILIGILTSVWEEWLFPGYIFSHIRTDLKNIWFSRLITASLFAAVHLPVLVVWHKFSPQIVVFQLLMLFILGTGNVILMEKSKNLIAPVISHFGWGLAIFLFR
ncbi:CPBP family intramembrane metalloprotease [Candidatus Collierbacteria bacterium]|nr:CPBP family intramembrane metalloprotease [Candidatus Collierbacteria bacterium]